MKRAALISCLSALLSSAALANEGFTQRACMIEGNFNLLGQTLYSKDCMQAGRTETDETAFRRSCSELAKTSAALGGNPGTVTYMAQCELPAQGICRNFMKSGRDAYYYARTTDDLDTLPQGCNVWGGQWAPGR